MKLLGFIPMLKMCSSMYRFIFSFALFMVFSHAYAEDLVQARSTETENHYQQVEVMLELMGLPEQVDKSAGEVLKLYSAKVEDSNTDTNTKLIVDAYQRDATKIVTLF